MAKHPAMRDADKHLVELEALKVGIKNMSGDETIARMLPELGALLVVVGEGLDKAQQKLVLLTWALLGLTAVLVVIAAVQVCQAIHK